MKVRALITLLLVVSVGATQAAAGARFAERQQLAPEEEREAREFVEVLFGRLEREQDFGPLLKELFVGDFAEQLHAAAREDGLFPFVDRAAAAELSRDELLRYHVASSNLLLLTSLHMTDARLAARAAKGGAPDEDEAASELKWADIFPPDVLELLKDDPYFGRVIAEEESADASDKDTITTAEQLRAFTATVERANELLRRRLTGEQTRRAFAEWRRIAATEDGATESPYATVLGSDWYGQPAGTRIVCFGLLLFHVDLIKVGGGFKVLAMYLVDD